jgi:hypothetical protein
MVPAMLRRLLIRGAALAAGVLAALALPDVAGAATVALWHMDETLGTTMVDGVGGNNGRLRNVALGQPGFLGAAYGFAGLGSVATVPSSAALNPGSAPFTATVHFRTSEVSRDDSEDVMRKGLSTNSKSYWKIELRPNAAHTRAQLRCYFHGSRTSMSIYASPKNVADGVWHTVQCFKQDALVGVIFDGKVRTKSVRIGSISNGAVLTLGAKSASDDAFGGLVDEAAFDR